MARKLFLVNNFRISFKFTGLLLLIVAIKIQCLSEKKIKMFLIYMDKIINQDNNNTNNKKIDKFIIIVPKTFLHFYLHVF